MTYEQDFFQIKIVDWQIVYACHICDEGFDHIQELKEHIEISHKDIVHLFSAKEADSNVVHESEEDLGHKYSDNNEVFATVEWAKEMKESLLKEIDKLCKSSEGSDTDGESM